MIARIILLSAFSVASSAFAQESQSVDYLLLRNGQVIDGRVEYAEGKIWVTKRSGSKIAFDENKIAAIGYSKSEIYWAKYSQLPVNDVQQHLDLFRWCLQESLWSEARNQLELLGAQQRDGDRIERLTLLLETRQQAWEHEQKQAALTITSLPALDEPVDSMIRQVGFVFKEESSPDLDRIESLRQAADDLPGPVVAMFKRKIEPLMVHSCITAQCHNRDSVAMPLQVVSIGQPIPKKLSQLNLATVLGYTDSGSPFESPVFAAAVLPHAGATDPIIKADSSQFHLLRIWLMAVSQSDVRIPKRSGGFLSSDLKVQPVAADDQRLAKAIPERVIDDFQGSQLPRGDQSSTNKESELPEIGNSDPKNGATATQESSSTEITGEDNGKSKPDKQTPAKSSRKTMSGEDVGRSPYDPDEFNRRQATGR